MFSVKRVTACAIAMLMVMSTIGCNTPIKPEFGYDPLEHVELGQYKGIEYSLDVAAIEEEKINERILSDQKNFVAYTEVKGRGASEGDKLVFDFVGSINGMQVDGFSNYDYEFIYGTDKFPVEGFTEALSGMKAGDINIVTLRVSEDFTQAPEYAGSKIVFEITMKSVQQPSYPMVTDEYAKEKFGCENLAAYKAKIKSELQLEIDNMVNAKKMELVFKQVQDNCTIKSYPEEFLNQKKEDYAYKIKMYSLMEGKDEEQYCQAYMNMSFDEYVKKNIAQEMIMCAVFMQEKLEVTEYDYKANLEYIAGDAGYSNKEAFEQKFGKEKIVTAMAMDKAQDMILENAVAK